MPLVIPFFGVRENLDPWFHIQEYFFPEEELASRPMEAMLCFCVRLALATVGFIEGPRLIFTFLCTLLYWLEMQSRYVHLLLAQAKLTRKRLRRRHDLCLLIKLYRQFQVVSKASEHFLNSWIASWLPTAFMMIVMGNVGSLKYFGELPLIVYAFLPVASLVQSVGLYLAFPYMVAVDQDTKLLLRKSQGEMVCKEKVILKELRSLKPVSLKLGQSFILKKHTKATFYDAIVMRTVDGLLL